LRRRGRACPLQFAEGVAEQRTTQRICAQDLAPLLATASGTERITAPIAAVDLDCLLSESRGEATVDLGDLLRAEIGAEDAHVPPWLFAVSPARLFVIAVSFTATLAVGIGVIAR
jgi:hypothetical protein